MISGIVYSIKETNKYCKFSLQNKEYIFFKNKMNTFNESIKIKSPVMQLMFKGSYVELTANAKNIIEDIYIDLGMSNIPIWYEEFKKYLHTNFIKSSHNCIDMMMDQIQHLNIKTCIWTLLLDNTKLLKDPFNKTLKGDVCNLLIFYKNYYQHLAMSNILKNDIRDSMHSFHAPTINKHIKKIATKTDYKTFRTNPFSVLDSTTSVLFNTLALFANKYKVEKNQSLEGTIVYCLYEKMKNGHTCFPTSILCKQVFKLMAQVFEPVTIGEIQDEIDSNKTFTTFLDKVMLTFVFKKEEYVASKIQEYIESYYDENNISGIDVGSHIESFELENNIKLNSKQKSAIKQVFVSNSGMTLMTGLPGSGKTSVVKCITFISAILELTCALAAPTGKSANRLGNEAFTVHRLLEPIPMKDGTFKFNKNEYDKIAYNIIVMDEISMLDIDLFYQFIKACNVEKTRILLIGDNNQLPSVSYGDVLKSLIKSKMIPHTHLSKVYRQSETSSIPVLAKMIVDRKIPNKKDMMNDSITLVPLENEMQIKKYVLDYYKNECKDQDIDKNIILIPTKKGETGTIKLNESIHRATYGELSVKKYLEGEKIICTSNTYSKGKDGNIDTAKSIFNGDSGYFKCYKEGLEIEMSTKEKESVVVPYDSIDYGYCISVHKSQGSEYEKVLLVLHHSHNMMLNNQVLYTALTRAKNHITIIGTLECIEKCIMTNNTDRFDILDVLISDGLEEEL